MARAPQGVALTRNAWGGGGSSFCYLFFILFFRKKGIGIYSTSSTNSDFFIALSSFLWSFGHIKWWSPNSWTAWALHFFTLTLIMLHNHNESFLTYKPKRAKGACLLQFSSLKGLLQPHGKTLFTPALLIVELLSNGFTGLEIKRLLLHREARILCSCACRSWPGIVIVLYPWLRY